MNLSKLTATTLAPGNLVPISTTRIIAGDKVRFKPSAFVQALPMVAPLVNGFKICLEYFFIPDRLYNSDLLLNFTGVTDRPEEVKFPQIVVSSDEAVELTESDEIELPNKFVNDAANFQKWQDLALAAVTPGSLADYLGVPVGFFPFKTNENYGNGETPEDVQKYYWHQNAIPALGYLDIVYNYYINQQTDYIPTANYLDYGDIPADGVPGQDSFYSDNIKVSIERIERLLRSVKLTSDPTAAISAFVDNDVAEPFNKLMSWSWFASRSSIFQRAFPDYYLEAWLRSSGYTDSSVSVDLDSDGNSISLRNISMQSHVQRWLDLALGGGSRYSDYVNAEFDVSRLKDYTNPLFLGSDRQYLGSKVIYQTTGFNDAESPLGSFAGQSSGGQDFKLRTFSFGENGYFMVIASLVPDVMYPTFRPKWHEDRTLADVYVPALDNIAMQPLMSRQLNPMIISNYGGGSDIEEGNLWFIPDSNAVLNSAVGYQPAWSELSFDISSVHGRLATTLRYWTLLRRYGEPFDPSFVEAWQKAVNLLTQGDFSYTYTAEQRETLLALVETMDKGFDPLPYVNAVAYNQSFADQATDAQNFVFTFTNSMTVSRLKGKVNVPSII